MAAAQGITQETIEAWRAGHCPHCRMPTDSGVGPRGDGCDSCRCGGCLAEMPDGGHEGLCSGCRTGREPRTGARRTKRPVRKLFLRPARERIEALLAEVTS